MSETLWLLAGIVGILFSALLILAIVYGGTLVVIAIIGEWEWFKSRKLKERPMTDKPGLVEGVSEPEIVEGGVPDGL